MRVFIAIDINNEIRKRLSDLQLQLQKEAIQQNVKKSDVKWVDPRQIHLTLKFLGEVADEGIVNVCNTVKIVADRNSSFDLTVESVGCFGGKSARVLWVGTGLGGDELLRLQNDLEQAMASAGWPEEARQFSGHLTLCRIRNSKAGAKLVQIADKYKDFKLGVISADALSVYQSQLMPAGPIYTALGNYKLR